MILKRIELRGFRGIREDLLLDIPTGFAVITGRNGAGKSTICDAVEFAITGRITKYEESSEKGETWDDYMWWRGQTPAPQKSVTLTFATKEGAEYSITRTPTSVTTSDNVDLSTILCFPGAKPRNALVELCRTSIIRDETIAAHSLDLAERDRYSFVRSALGTDALETLEEQAKKFVAQLKARREEAIREYDLRRQELSSILVQVSSAHTAVLQSAEIAQAEAVVRGILARSDASTAEIRQIARKTVSELRLQIDAIARLAREAVAVREEADSQENAASQYRVTQLQQVIAQSQGEINSLDQLLNDLRRAANQDVQDVRLRLAALHEHGSALGIIDGACPLCMSELTEEAFKAALDALAAQLDELSKAAAHRQSRVSQLAQTRAAIAEKVTIATRELASVQAAAEALAQRRATVELSAQRLGIEIGGLSAAPFDAAIAQRIEQISRIERPLAVLDSSAEVERVASLQTRGASARTAAERADRRRVAVEAAHQRAHSYVGSIQRAFGELVEERLAALEPLLQELYARLHPHSEWEDISYRMRGDIRRFLSLRVGQDLNPKYVFSSGQRRAAGLAFLLAVHLSRPWCRLRTLLLDDPVQHIDDFRALHLVELLSSLRGDGRQIVCTVEDPALADLLCRRLRSGAALEGHKIELEYVSGPGVRVKSVTPVPPPTELLALSA